MIGKFGKDIVGRFDVENGRVADPHLVGENVRIHPAQKRRHSLAVLTLPFAGQGLHGRRDLLTEKNANSFTAGQLALFDSELRAVALDLLTHKGDGLAFIEVKIGGEDGGLRMAVEPTALALARASRPR